jgi:molybdopterin-guanine dinucleotide biosynthesis protein B
MRPKAISVVGFKNSGKTKVVEALIKELTEKGYVVGTLKHTAEDVQLDTPGKDTYRHRMAGSKSTGIMHNYGAAFFIDKYLSLQKAEYKLGTLDFLVIEGFKSVNTHAKVIVPRNPNDVKELSNGLEVAVVLLPEVNLSETSIPIVPFSNIERLAEIVAEKAFPLLPGLNCHDCGYDDCLSMGKAILKKEARISQCIGFNDSYILKVNGLNVPLKGFVREAIENVVLGFVKTLKGGQKAERIELKFEVKRNE